MKKILKIGFASAILALSYSCEKDFLEKQPSQFLTADQIEDAAAVKPESFTITLANDVPVAIVASAPATPALNAVNIAAGVNDVDVNLPFE